MSKLLILGPLQDKHINKPGGIVVLFNDILKQLKGNKVEFKVIDTNICNYKNRWFGLLSIYFKIIFFSVKFDHISLHGTAKDYLYIAPMVTLISKIFIKKCSLRKFAGNFDTYYASSNFLSKFTLRLTLKYSDYIFFETKKLCAFFQNYNNNVFWFPNVRDIKQKSFVNKEFCEKYVFISSVKRTKGIYEIVKVFSELPNKYTIDIFGPIEDEGLNAGDIEISENIRYRGSVDSSEVPKILDRYNVLLLPTFHPGEGYPGVIIEAFAAGLPVITTRWNSIPEMVIDGYNGRLIDPKNFNQLKDCITEINKEYLKLSKNSYDSFVNYDSFDQTRLFLKTIRGLS